MLCNGYFFRRYTHHIIGVVGEVYILLICVCLGGVHIA